MRRDARTLGLGIGALLVLAAAIAGWLAGTDGGRRFLERGARGHADPALDGARGAPADDRRARADASIAATDAPRGGARDPREQDQSTEGRTDGAVPYVATPPYASPTEDLVVLTPEALNQRRLEQVGLIERQIAELDRSIQAAPEGPMTPSLLARREHLEGRRADLLAAIADDAN